MNSLILSLLIGVAVVAPNIARADPEDPFGGEPVKPREISEAGRKTLEILQTEKLDVITLDPGEPQKGFELLKARLAKRGIVVRLKHYGDPKSKYIPGGPLALQNIPLDKFMQYFDQWAWWGWILYPDGSITYFDNQCACTWPKDGVWCHDDQYEAGKPDVMAKEQKAATDEPRAEPAGADQPATKPADKPSVKDQAATPTSKDGPR